ncbi:MAG: WG repeat-containing protein [Oliverpabstia sp.]
MYCQNCGQKISGMEKFCPFCGTSIRTDTTGKKNSVKKSVPKRGLAGKIVIVLLIIVLFVAGGIVIRLFSGSDKSSEKAEIESGGFGNTEAPLDSENKENNPVADEPSEQLDEQEDDSYLALVRDEDGKYGYINEEGEEVIACQYDIAYGFCEDGSEMAAVGKENGVDAEGNVLYKWGYIDRKGTVVIPMKYDAVRTEGVASCPVLAVAKQIGTDSFGNPVLRWGFVDKKGNIISECKYIDDMLLYKLNANISKTGLMRVAIQTDDDEEGSHKLKYGVINIKGEEVIPFGKYEHIDFSISDNGLIAVENLVGADEEALHRWGCIDEKGNVIIPFEYDDIGVFSENGLCAVQKTNGRGELKYGYINEQGKECIPFEFEYAGTFQNGLAAVKDESDHLGFINEQGNLVVPYKYWGLSSGFNQKERAIVQQREEDSEGNFVVNEGMINAKGDEVLPCQYSDISLLSLDLYRIQNGEKCGCVDYDGKLILPVQYDMLEAGSNGWIVVGTYDGKYDEDTDRYRCQYMDANGNVMLQLPEKYIYAEGFTKS